MGENLSFLSLKIFKQSQFVKTKIFTDDQISVGSSEGLSLQLEGISPWHLLIEKKLDIFCILDLNSETGTLLNGQRITDETPLTSGSVITVGPYEIHFFIGPPVEKPSVQSEKPTLPNKELDKPVLKEEVKKPLSFGTEGQATVRDKKEKDTETAKGPDRETAKQPATEIVKEAVKETVKQPVPEAVKGPDTEAPLLVPSVSDQKEQPESFEKEGRTASKATPSSSPLKETEISPQAFKPRQKGFWSTYAPSSKIQNLDEFLTPSIGNLIEVLVCWKERVLQSHFFSKAEDVFMGSEPSCQIKMPNMLGQKSYKLLSIAGGVRIFLSQSVTGLLFVGKDKTTRTSHKLQGNQTLVLKPYEMVKLEFSSALKVYVRLMDKPSKPPFAGILNLRVSEMVALFLAFLLTGLLVFYGSLYAPAFLAKDEEFIEKDVRIAKVIFEKPPKARPKVVKLDIKDVESKPKVKKPPKKVKPKKQKKATIKTVRPKKQKKPRKFNAPKKGKTGKMAAQAPGKKRNRKKITVGSVRPGGSLKTGKKGSSAKTVAPDPSKMGLLGTFGGGGKLSKLDKGASGSGGLLGLAEESTGFAGTEESYGGEGIGTKTKDLGSGGKGSSLVGISGIKTKGKGLGTVGTGSGGLGKRGRMNIEFGTEDIEVSGEIDRGAILAVLKRNQSKFSRCYQISLNQNPSAQGNLGMQWQISSNGRGRQAQAVNDSNSK